MDFPELTLDVLQNLTIGIYQIKLVPSYVQDTLQREKDEEFHIKMLRETDRIPEQGFMRVRVFSRFRNVTKYQLWIAYRSCLRFMTMNRMMIWTMVMTMNLY